MKLFRTFLLESRQKLPIVWTFGRMNPPTLGHGLLVHRVMEVARHLGAEHRIYLSHSHDRKSNPLTYEQKLHYMRAFFPHANIVNDPHAISAFHIAQSLSDEGYKDVTMVVGSDRVPEFQRAIGKYVKNHTSKTSYDFDRFNVVSAGERDPDAEGVSGMSASKMREAASKGWLMPFEEGCPNKQYAKQMFNDVRKGMGLAPL